MLSRRLTRSLLARQGETGALRECAVAAGRLPVDARLTACAQLFEAAKLPLIVRITPWTLPAALDTLLQRKAWRASATRA